MSRNLQTSVRATPKDHLMWRVVDYLNANPTEVLTRSDIAAKFETSASTVDSLLGLAVAAGMIKREHDTPDGTIWRHVKSKSAVPRPFSPSFAAAKRAVKGSIQRVDFAAIEVDRGVPIHEAALPSSQWKALFDRMEPGDSFQLPSRSAAALSHAKLKYCKLVDGARFTVRKISSTHTRIWRTA